MIDDSLERDPARWSDAGAQAGTERSAPALLARLPPPDASPAALEAIWRGVSLPRGKDLRPLRLALGGVALGAAAAAAAFLALPRPLPPPADPAPQLDWASGEVTFDAEGYATGDDGQAIVAFDRSRILLSPNTQAHFASHAHRTTVQLAAGRVVLQVSPRAAGEYFAVQAGDTEVVVRGTRFAVERTGDNLAVICTHGQVEVEVGATPGGAHLAVPAGSSWHSGQLTALADHQGLDDGLLDGDQPGNRPVPPPLPAPAITPFAAPAPATSHPRLAKAEDRTDDAYAQALALDRRGRHPEAAAALRQIIARHQPNADLALYHLAELEQGPLADRAAAEQDFSRYAKDYPQGALDQEAELSALQLQLERSAFSEALAGMNAFLAQHPGSERSSKVHLLRGNLLRSQGKAGPALADYAQTQGAEADDALFYTAQCQRTLGHTDAAAAALKDYLQRFPQGNHAADAREALGGR